MDQSYRDTYATIDKQGKRMWIFARQPQGKLYNIRTIVSVILLLLFFGLPFVKVAGEPFILLNLFERHFIIFGVIFWTQDSYLFFLMMISFIVFIILFTSIFGRVWCGWVCPQTVFTEMVFRRIEYWIEGNAGRQKALAMQVWNFDKIWRKLLKFTVFWLIALLTTLTLLAYIISVDEILKLASEPLTQHKTGYIALFVFTTILYIIFTYLRELVCIIICPYGRLQGVLLDSNSLVVAYNYHRGEPRGKASNNENQTTQGDCVDDRLCVAVCPTGIDIRNGTQLECTNCTACIDACNAVMKRNNKPKGLIRFASERGIERSEKFRVTPRIALYSLALTLIIGFFSYLFISRSEVETTIIRTQGLLYQEQSDNKISNLYNYKLVNKTRNEILLEFRLLEPKGELKLQVDKLILKPDSKAEGLFFIFLEKQLFVAGKTDVVIGIYSGDKQIEVVKTGFVGPQ